MVLGTALCLAACEAQPAEQNPAGNGKGTYECSINASSIDTRTVNNGLHTEWQDTDILSIFYQNANGYGHSAFTYSGNNVFTGKVTDPAKPGDWYAVYPESSGNVTPASVSVTIPAASKQSGNGSMAHLAGEGFPLVGEASAVAEGATPTFAMCQVAAVGKFVICNTTGKAITVSRIEFTAPAWLAGSFRADLTTSLSWEAAGSNSKTVVLNVEDAQQIAAGESAEFYMGMMPFSATGEYTISVFASCEDTEAECTKVLENQSITLSAGTITRIGFSFVHENEDPDEPMEPETGNVYEKVSAEPANWSGTYFVVNTAGNKLFAPFAENASSYAVDVTVKDGKIVSNAALDKYAVTISGGTDNHGNLSGKKAYDVKNSDGKYIFYSQGKLMIQDNNRNIGDNNTEYSYRHAFSYDANGVQMISSGTTSGQSKYYHNFANGAFIYQKDQTANRVQLYKLAGTAPIIIAQDQNLTFADESVTIATGFEQALQLGDVIDLPQTVMGAETEVTYSSSDSSVAELTGNSKIRINGEGQTTITATAAESEYWNAASASYTITVVNYEQPVPPAPAGYYVKLDEDPGQSGWAGKYLVVNTAENKAFAAFSNVSGYAVDVQPVDGIIEATADVDRYALTVAGGTQDHSNGGGKAYDVMNADGKYVWVSGSAIQISDSNAKSGYSYMHTFTFSSNGVQMRSSRMSGGSSKYYITYSGSAFAYNSTESNRVQLYRYQEGPVKRSQNLMFPESSITWNVGEGQEYKTGSTYAMPQTAGGAQTAVTYSSSDTAIAEIVGNSQIRINAAGSVTITATAAENDEYKSASASYTLTIKDHEAVPETDLGTFNLESNALNQYLNATSHYTDDNWKTVTVITSSPFSSMCGVGGEGYDFPTPVTVNWTGNNKQNVTVSIYSDSSRSADSLDQTASSTSTSVKFYNLIPNRKYYYTVALNDGTELDRGYFNTTGRRRQLKTTNTVSEDYATNVRDLGGMVTSDNKTLNYGLVYRGSNMRRIGSAEKAVIRDYMKVRLDVDLRRDEYGVTATSVFPESEVAYSHVAYDGTSMTDFLNKSKVNKTFSDIISYVSQGKAVYIHCKSGADRTGYVCMLIEAVCGVSLADCTKDYEITSFSKAGSRDRCGQKNAYLFQEALKHVLAAEGSTFQQKAINTLKTDGGITDAQIKALQDAMIQK